jgi:hypothetical protein
MACIDFSLIEYSLPLAELFTASPGCAGNFEL